MPAQTPQKGPPVGDTPGSQVGGIAKSAGQQLAREPFEVTNEALEQFLGLDRQGEPQPEAPSEARETPKPEISPEKEERLKVALKKELEDMMLAEQHKREQETHQRWEEQEQLKEERERQRELVTEQAVPEPQGKRKRGLLAGITGFLKKKQQKVELQRMPSN